nr:hypothetical protein 8 [bacterium]
MFNQTQQAELIRNWKNQRPLTLSMTIKGALECSEQPEILQQKLKRASLESTANQRLQEEGGEPSELPPAVAASPEDFIEVTYRALSAATLADRPIDFSNERVLKRAVRLLKGQTVFKDHDTSVDNWVGRVEKALWDNQTQGIPPGINAQLKLDAVKDPMTVRGVVQGVIHSASVTVSFEWKPSHPKLMDEGTFFERMGEEVDDELVRIIVTKIDKFLEISLVWQGADEFAKQIGANGKPVQQSIEPESLHDTGQLSLRTQDILSKEDDMNPMNKLLCETFGTEVNPDNFKEVLNQYVETEKTSITEKADTQISKLVEQLNESNKNCSELEAKLKALEPQAQLGETYLEDERQEAIRLCKLVKGEKINEAILKTLENGELELVQAWKEEFRKEAETKFPNKCAKCGSTEIQRQSSLPSKDQESADKKSSVLSKQTSEYVKNLHVL